MSRLTLPDGKPNPDALDLEESLRNGGSVRFMEIYYRQFLAGVRSTVLRGEVINPTATVHIERIMFDNWQTGRQIENYQRSNERLALFLS